MTKKKAEVMKNPTTKSTNKMGNNLASSKLKENPKINTQIAKSPLNRSLKSDEVIFLALQPKFLFKR
jgi:hypothetical protein